MPKDLDRQIATIARRQLGVFNRVQATGAGFTARMIRIRLSNSEWTQLERDIFALDAYPSSWEQRCFAATLLHPAAAVSHATSGAVLGLDGFPAGRVHVTVPPVALHRSKIATVHRSRHHEFVTTKGLRVTSFAQTIVQLAATASERRLRSALHSGIHQAPKRLDELTARVCELRDRRMPGMNRLVALIDELNEQPPTASELERVLFEVMAGVPGMPPVVRQSPMPWSPTKTTLVDGHVVAWGLIVEADGRRWHTRVADFENDRWRDAEAAAHGLHVMRFTWRRLREDVDGVLDQLTRFGQTRLAADSTRYRPAA